MARKEFILQGFTSRTHAAAVRKLFEIPQVERAVISVAFVSENGVRLLEESLRAHAAETFVFAGIRNDITSYQGLLRLYSILGQNLFTVDTGRRRVVYHPKLFLVRGASRAGLVIGSANLTVGGLNNNIEAGMLLDFDLADAADLAVVEGIESQFLGLPELFPANIRRVATLAALDNLNAAGLLADEKVIRSPVPDGSGQSGGMLDTVPAIQLRVAQQPRIAAIAPIKRSRRQVAQPEPNRAEPSAEAAGRHFELTWESKPLAQSDLNIPHSLSTHAKGSMSLDKGLLSEDVDHRPYFRESVFQFLPWRSKNETVDEASARCSLFIKGIDCGEFDIWISHTTSTTSKTYLQKNAMTRLRWGTMRPLIARTDLIDRTLSLYRDLADPTRFRIEID